MQIFEFPMHKNPFGGQAPPGPRFLSPDPLAGFSGKGKKGKRGKRGKRSQYFGEVYASGDRLVCCSTVIENLSMLLTAVNLVAGTGSDRGTDISGHLRRLSTGGFLQ